MCLMFENVRIYGVLLVSSYTQSKNQTKNQANNKETSAIISNQT